MNNHEKKVLREIISGELRKGSISFVEVTHDDWCGYLRGGECNCNPDIKETPYVWPDISKAERD